MAKQKQGDQLEPTYSSSVRIRGVALTTCRKRCTIGRGGERGSRISVLMTRHHDDDDLERFFLFDCFFLSCPFKATVKLR